MGGADHRDHHGHRIPDPSGESPEEAGRDAAAAGNSTHEHALTRRYLAALTLLVTAAAWGATFTLVKNILGRIAPEPFIFLRFTLAGLVLMLVTLPRRRVTRDLIRPGVILGLLVFAGYWLQTHGLMLISPSRSAFLTGLYVVMVPFCDALVYRVRVSLRAWAGSVLALIGTAAMIGGFDARPGIGDALTVACAAVFAFHVILSARFSALHSATGLAAVQVLMVGLAAAPASLFAPRPQFTRDIVIVIIFTAIVTTALAFAALMWAQAHVSATEAAVILAFEPVAAALTSIIWYHEPLTIAFVAGASLILCAMIVSQTSATIRTDGPNPRHQ
jgi:drug/metabolite transporter (DMT)-like permease